MLAAEFLRLANNSFLNNDRVNYAYYMNEYKKEMLTI